MEQKILTLASLGTFKVCSRLTKSGLVYDIKRIIGFVFTPDDGRVRRVKYQRIYTHQNLEYALITGLALCRLYSSQVDKINVSLCFGKIFCVYLSGKIANNVVSRINENNYTNIFRVIDPAKTGLDYNRKFWSYESYLKFVLERLKNYGKS